MTPIRIAALVARLWPIAREFISAIDRSSDGGKRITARERQAILDAALVETRAVLDDYAAKRAQ